jgi:hypothetical protein
MLARAIQVAFVVVCCAAPCYSQDAPLNLLFFGNSFTIGSGVNVPTAVGRIAEADGYAAPLIVADLEGGQDLDYHIGQIRNRPQDNVAASAIEGKEYDFAVIQGYSTEATHLQDPANDFIPDAVEISSLIRSQPTGPDAKIVLFETWAREAPHSFYTGANPVFSEPAEMQSEIRTNYLLAVEAIKQDQGAVVATMAPVGDAFQAGGFDASYYASDNYHASNLGYRLASLMIYRTIYDEMVGDIEYSSVANWVGVSEAQWTALTSLADSVPVTSVPEPTSAMLFVIAISGLAVCRCRQR